MLVWKQPIRVLQLPKPNQPTSKLCDWHLFNLLFPLAPHKAIQIFAFNYPERSIRASSMARRGIESFLNPSLVQLMVSCLPVQSLDLHSRLWTKLDGHLSREWSCKKFVSQLLAWLPVGSRAKVSPGGTLGQL